VVNLFEGNPDDGETESYVAGLLQWQGVPFTGSPMRALSLARNKPLTKQLFRGAGLPSADYQVVHNLPVRDCRLTWPIIVKPAHQDASVGVTQESVCVNAAQLEQRVAYILETYGAPVLLEEFIAGREAHVSLMELPALQWLPPAEIIFTSERPGYWPILTFDSKWTTDSAEFQALPPQCPADLDAGLSQRLGNLALQAYQLLGCRDYARVDFRIKSNGQPYILEVNPNPEISSEASYTTCLKAAGIGYRDFLVRLVEHARNRITPKLRYALGAKLTALRGHG
jgi:D-alanine-D-alanine ligase